MSAKEFRGADSKINHCMWAFAEYVARVRPVMAIFESVQQAHNRPDGLQLMRDLRAHVEQQTGLSYTLHHVLHNAYSVGGCSQRPRYFWVISQVPFGIERPKMATYPFLRDAIEDLADLPLMWGSQLNSGSTTNDWVSWRTSPEGYVDGHASIDNPLTGRLRDLMAGVQWDEGQHVAQVARAYYEQHGELPLSWKSTEEKLIAQDFFMGFTTPVRWKADQPARVITGGGPIMAVHPWLDRTLTHREIARIMGFTDDWLIEPLQRVPGLGMTWGKGITVDCGRWIADWVLSALGDYPGTYIGEPTGDREFTIDVTHDWKRHATWYSKTVAPKRTSLSPVRRRIMTEPDGAVATETTKISRTEKLTARDEQVFELLSAGAKTRNEVGEATGLTVAETYLALDRLRKTDRVRSEKRNGKNVWFRPDVLEPVPAE